MLRTFKVCVFLLLAGLSFSTKTQAAEKPETRETLARALTSEGDEQIKLIGSLADSDSDLVRKTLESWPRDEIFLYEKAGTKVAVLLDENRDTEGRGKALRIDTNEYLQSDAGEPLLLAPSDLTQVETDPKVRRAIKGTLDLMTLADPNAATRRSAIMKLGMTQKKEYLPVLEARVPKEKNSSVQKALSEASAIIRLQDENRDVQVSAIRTLAKLHSIPSLDMLRKLAVGSSPAAVAARDAVKSLESYISVTNFFGTLFRGLSLGSILLVVALGLAITFGLMGVINMAHGEMIAVGAYTSYVVQNLFGSGLDLSPFGFHVLIPGCHFTGWLFECYFVLAIPLAFLAAALAGIALERGVIRFLYSRPLESLLATWGVSLVLQQTFRRIFGSANVQVNSPSWLAGNFTISDVVLGYNRLFVIGFAVVIVLMTWLLLTKTPLGLLIRAVMQNRDMAACVGVRTERVNMMTFAFGSGLAGLAGAFLSQIGNVGPSLGQSYIVDCFMTVVVGGVGNIIGTICSALGIGVIDQTLQPILGPVMGKITVLVAIILFLQWKPGGLFPTRSRSLEG